MSNSDPLQILEKIENRLKYMERMGVQYLEIDNTRLKEPAPARVVSEPKRAKPIARPKKPVVETPVIDQKQMPELKEEFVELLATDSLPQPPVDRSAVWKEIVTQIAGCRYCGLCATRTNTVPGVGDLNAPIVFVGEGPGFNEDQQGLPFVGRSGNLLTKMIEAMGYSRDDIFICNVVKCRPPDNRDPNLEEIEKCEPYLKKTLEIIQPKVIVGLGKYACQTLLNVKTPISRLRGNWHTYYHIPFMPTFHPAYLLRSPGEKRHCWEDLQQVMVKIEEVN